MGEKIADFELKHKGTSYSQNNDGNLVATVNWETEGDMEVYGAVYGTLTVVIQILMPIQANAVGQEKASLRTEQKLLVFNPELGKNLVIMNGH